MTDERTLQSASKVSDRMVDEDRARKNAVKTYTVIVLRSGRPEQHTVKAVNADERGQKMAALGIDISRDEWAAGYYDDRRKLQMCGTSKQAERLVAEALRR